MNSGRKNKWRLFFLAIGILSLFLAENSKAQENIRSEVIANVNIRDTEIREVGKGQFEISFSGENSMDVQSNLVYGLELIRKLEDGKIIFSDSKVFEGDKLTIRKGESVKKKIIYQAPDFLLGKYELWLKIKDESGMILALQSFQIELTGSGKYVEFGNPCFLAIEGEDKKYSLVQGVDIKKEEVLVLECVSSNKTEEDGSFTPNFSLYQRDYFGKKISDWADEGQKIYFSAGESKNIKIKIPTPEKPQAYDAKFFLTNKDGVISNPIYAHFVLSGFSATIVNASLDKEVYKSGETAVVSVILASSADGFPGSRNGMSVLTDTVLEVKMKDENGFCADEYKYDWTGDGQPFKKNISIPVKKDCSDPYVSLNLVRNGELLSEKNINLNNGKSELPVSSENANKEKRWMGDLILVIFIISGFISLLLIFWKVKNWKSLGFFVIAFVSAFLANDARGETAVLYGTPWMMSLQYSAAVGANFVQLESCNPDFSRLRTCPSADPQARFRPCKINGYNVMAHTDGKYYGCYQDIVSYTYSLDDTSVYQGQNITASASGVGTNTCNNGVTLGVGVSLKDGTYEVLKNVFTNDQVERSGSYTFNTGNYAVGNYTATFQYHFGHGSSNSDYQGNGGIGFSVYQGKSCNLPWGGSINHNSSVTAYSASSVPCGSSCASVSETRTCVDGFLSGSYTNGSCSVQSCAVNGTCGTADEHIYLSTEGGWGEYALCSTGTDSNPIFPMPGGSSPWNCWGINGGSFSACKAYRNECESSFCEGDTAKICGDSDGNGIMEITSSTDCSSLGENYECQSGNCVCSPTNNCESFTCTGQTCDNGCMDVPGTKDCDNWFREVAP